MHLNAPAPAWYGIARKGLSLNPNALAGRTDADIVGTLTQAMGDNVIAKAPDDQVREWVLGIRAIVGAKALDISRLRAVVASNDVTLTQLRAQDPALADELVALGKNSIAGLGAAPGTPSTPSNPEQLVRSMPGVLGLVARAHVHEVGAIAGLPPATMATISQSLTSLATVSDATLTKLVAAQQLTDTQAHDSGLLDRCLPARRPEYRARCGNPVLETHPTERRRTYVDERPGEAHRGGLDVRSLVERHHPARRRYPRGRRPGPGGPFGRTARRYCPLWPDADHRCRFPDGRCDWSGASPRPESARHRRAVPVAEHQWDRRGSGRAASGDAGEGDGARRRAYPGMQIEAVLEDSARHSGGQGGPGSPSRRLGPTGYPALSARIGCFTWTSRRKGRESVSLGSTSSGASPQEQTMVLATSRAISACGL